MRAAVCWMACKSCARFHPPAACLSLLLAQDQPGACMLAALRAWQVSWSMPSRRDLTPALAAALLLGLTGPHCVPAERTWGTFPRKGWMPALAWHICTDRSSRPAPAPALARDQQPWKRIIYASRPWGPPTAWLLQDLALLWPSEVQHVPQRRASRDRATRPPPPPKGGCQKALICRACGPSHTS